MDTSGLGARLHPVDVSPPLFTIYTTYVVDISSFMLQKTWFFSRMAGYYNTRKRSYKGKRAFKKSYQKRKLSKYIAQVSGVIPGYTRSTGYYGRFSGTTHERKFHDLVIDDTSIATAGEVMTTGTINTIVQGVTESTRIGRKINVTKIMWNWNVFLKATTVVANTIDNVRMILFLDKQCNGATAAVGDLLETADYQSFNNLANKDRFVVLYDKKLTFTAAAGGGNTTSTAQWIGAQRHGSFHKSCNIPIEYDNEAPTGAIGTIRSNNLAVLLISESGHCSLTSQIRLRFTDM